MIAIVKKVISNIDDTYVYQVEIEWTDLVCSWQVYKDTVDAVYVNNKPLDTNTKIAIFDTREVMKKDNALYIYV
jgi:hypothetical protein